jgi:ATP-dependent Zn protease
VEKSIEPWASWGACEDRVAQRALERIGASAPRFFAEAVLESARAAALSFYRRHRLLEVRFRRDHRSERAFLLDDGNHTEWLDGGSSSIHATNAAEELALTDATVHDYLRFFLYFLRASEGAFNLLESPAQLTKAEHEDGAAASKGEDAQISARLLAARAEVRPLRTTPTSKDGRWRLEGSLAYGGTLFGAIFAVAGSGEIEMVEDTPGASLESLAVPTCPSLDVTARPAGNAEAEEHEEIPSAQPSGSEIREEKLPRDREVTEAVVGVLLEEAIRARESNFLLLHFNSEAAADRPIDRLTRMVLGSVPIIVIEADIPFVEDFVAGLLEACDPAVTRGGVMRASTVPGDDLKCSVDYNREHASLHLISFHAYRTLWDAERTAHELSICNAAVLIGCERISDVPEPLRRVTDLVLQFPRIERRLFARIFERVFEAKPSVGWDAPGADWTRYLLPPDFHVPKRLGLGPDEALSLLKERVASRLRTVSADSSPALADLHGLGEARQIAEDLIADVRSAQAGEIPWSAVDRGLLLVGRPGTGKTTLARAIAKECGIKFIVASAARWQAAGYLDAHLRAMRADFVEARRYAPAILFIDEVDSIGSREQLTGSAQQYQTEVINALLELIQGFEVEAPVVVMAATNYLDKVDPALRRPGRLDQVVQIPLPNIPSLEQIFRYYLAPYRVVDQVAADVDERLLAQLAFGLTGADVEFFVRGAARRARHDQRPISQADLSAEVTRRPRRPESVPQLGPAEMRRVAVHEAGHALAGLTSSTQGEQFTFITIVPRTDGSLGFVASVPLDEVVLTRRAMIERLEVTLAGRAAEEIVFGKGEVGLGAGGPSRSSDLAVATAIASSLVCQSGLGGDGGLQWTAAPLPRQEHQIELLLRNAYHDVRGRLADHRTMLDRIADSLVSRQEMSGAELRQLVFGRLAVARSGASDHSGQRRRRQALASSRKATRPRTPRGGGEA